MLIATLAHMRGFNLEDSQIERTDRLDRLVFVLSFALYWAVSTGMWDAMENETPAEKKPRRLRRKNVGCGLISRFKRGPRRLQFRFQRLILSAIVGGMEKGWVVRP